MYLLTGILLSSYHWMHLYFKIKHDNNNAESFLFFI